MIVYVHNAENLLSDRISIVSTVPRNAARKNVSNVIKMFIGIVVGRRIFVNCMG
jgi:hypothetical protein